MISKNLTNRNGKLRTPNAKKLSYDDLWEQNLKADKDTMEQIPLRKNRGSKPGLPALELKQKGNIIHNNKTKSKAYPCLKKKQVGTISSQGAKFSRSKSPRVIAKTLDRENGLSKLRAKGGRNDTSHKKLNHTPLSRNILDPRRSREDDASDAIITEIRKNFKSELVNEVLENMANGYSTEKTPDPRKPKHVKNITQDISQTFENCIFKGNKTSTASTNGALKKRSKKVLSTELDKANEKALNKLKSRFDIVRLIGQGSYSAIYLAKERQTESMVALKLAKSSDSEISKEFKCLRSLEHPGIVQAYQFINGTAGCNSVLVMEYAGSRTLRDLQLVEHNKVFNEERVLQFTKELIGILTHAHGRGIAHCDLKLDNIVYNSEQGNIKLIDFGFAGAFESRISNFYCGTPNYMCPQLLGRKPFCPFKADVWALGVVLYKLKFNRFPFGGKTEQEILHKIRVGEICFAYTNIKCGNKLQKFIRSLLVGDEDHRMDIIGVRKKFYELFKHI